MVKQIILHVGAHKTATTALQQLMGDRLAAVSGGRAEWVKLEEMRRRYSPLLRSPNEGSAAKLKMLLEDGRESETVVLSDENVAGRVWPDGGRLYPHSGERVLRACETLSAYRLSVVVTLRNPATFLPSAYLEYLRHQPYKTFDEWKDGLDPTAFSFDDVFDWRYRLPPDVPFYALPYEAAYGGGFDAIVASFLSLCCLSEDRAAELTRLSGVVRPSITEEELVMAGGVAKLFGATAGKIFVQHLDGRRVSAVRRRLHRLHKKPFRPFGDDETRRMTARYEADLDLFRRPPPREFDMEAAESSISL